MEKRNADILKIFQSIHRIHSLMNSKRDWHNNELNFTQLKLLLVVIKKGPIIQKELAELLDIKQSTLSVKLKSMENKGLIQTNYSEKDRRISYVAATKEAYDLIAEYKEKSQRCAGLIFSDFSNQEVADLQVLIQKLMDGIERSNKC